MHCCCNGKISAFCRKEKFVIKVPLPEALMYEYCADVNFLHQTCTLLLWMLRRMNLEVAVNVIVPRCWCLALSCCCVHVLLKVDDLEDVND
jgi:hypothetical protein